MSGGDDQSARERAEDEDALHHYVFNVKVEGRAFHDEMVAPVVLHAIAEYRVPYTRASLEPSDLVTEIDAPAFPDNVVADTPDPPPSDP
jgi:hypothetical protein